ncbi:single-stranded DNA-binding protein [Pedobacter jamesrossensis]|uniref:Single-stranded DNA-binding protein n=1 Tax=Pedobacter jamesrossensis TaxID=1908238 RepID=A0ABV8NLV8_9SPHI
MEILTGRLTADAEVREVSERAKVVGFTIAVNHSYMSGEQRREIARFFECSYWRNAGIAEFLKKGDVVQVFGHVGCKAYVTRDAEAAAALTFRVAEIKLFSSGAKTANVGEAAGEASE